jgi:hypothetical protein
LARFLLGAVSVPTCAAQARKKSAKKTRKVLDGKAVLPYFNSMTNDFANISAESNLSDMIALRIEDFTGPIPESWGGEPMELTEAEKAEANIWFDERRDSWMMELVGTI